MRQFIAASATVISLAVAGLTAQTQTRDTQSDRPTATGAGIIAGTVVSFENGRPVRFATVTLSGSNGQGEFRATTDDAGGFSFRDLSAGTFRLSVSKSGFLDARYGQTRPGTNTPGTPIRLAAGQRLEKLKLPISRGGAIVGTVLDDHGDPAFQATVDVMRWTVTDGSAALETVQSQQTDDRGMYRVSRLPPGRYVVRAIPDERATLDAGGNPLTMGYAPVFHPSSPSISGAVVITVGLGDERSSVDIQLALVPRTRVAGVVVDADGKPASAAVELVDHALPGADVVVQSAHTDDNGRFAFEGVAPGAYTVEASTGTQHEMAFHGRISLKKGSTGSDFTIQYDRLFSAKEWQIVTADKTPGIEKETGAAPEPPRWAEEDLSLTGAPLQDLRLTLQPGRSVSGRVTFNGSSPPSALQSPLIVQFERISGRADGESRGAATAKVARDGTFTMPDLVPGRYHVDLGADGVPDPWTLASAMAGGRDTLDSWLDVPSDRDVRDLAINLRDRMPDLSGALIDPANQAITGYTVVVFPVDESLWTAGERRIRSVVPSSDGRYTFASLPAGAYRVAVITDGGADQIPDPDFLRSIAGASVSITIADGEKRTQDLRIR